MWTEMEEMLVQMPRMSIQARWEPVAGVVMVETSETKEPAKPVRARK